MVEMMGFEPTTSAVRLQFLSAQGSSFRFLKRVIWGYLGHTRLGTSVGT